MHHWLFHPGGLLYRAVHRGGGAVFPLLRGQGPAKPAFLYQKFEAVFKTRKSVYMDATDSVFNAALSIVRPFLLVTLCFAAVNYLITVCFNVDSAQHLFMKAVDALFIKMQRSYFT